MFDVTLPLASVEFVSSFPVQHLAFAVQQGLVQR